MASESNAPEVVDLGVMEDYIGSEHQYINFNLGMNRHTNPHPLFWGIRRRVDKHSEKSLGREWDFGKNTIMRMKDALGTIIDVSMRLIGQDCEGCL